MSHDIRIFELFGSNDLSGNTIEISFYADRRCYQLDSLLGQGQTAVAWKASDSFGRHFAVKFVSKSDYKTHSLEGECNRARSLESELFAKIEFYGEFKIQDSKIDCTNFYAIVVDWIDGETLSKYLASPSTQIDSQLFLRLVRDFCEILESLKAKELTHNDLHDKNILVSSKKDPLSNETISRLMVIDTGQLKTIDRKANLIEKWSEEINTLGQLGDTSNEVINQIKLLEKRVNWFDRTDHEWVVSHICAIHNNFQKQASSNSPESKRFLASLPESLKRMIDSDPSRRLDDPKQIYQEINRLYLDTDISQRPIMTSPFDLPSAELIRSDKQLMALFSEQYPCLDTCRSYSPTYIYGPRGCGKSTILRSLSFNAIYQCDNPEEELTKIPFIGIYISCSQELRSRFWLMDVEDFDKLEGHVIQFFNLLLVEGLVNTFDWISRQDSKPDAFSAIKMTEQIASSCASVIRSHLNFTDHSIRYAGTTHFSILRNELQKSRNLLWAKILDRSEPSMRSNPQLIFDICSELEGIWPILRTRRIVFLIDDYSNQRIPTALQKKLNQTITFSKQGSTIFKVTSEYDGVDLEGVQEGREVFEVNVGNEYVNLQDSRRYSFLQNVLERRFEYLDTKIDLTTVLPLSGISPTIPMARAIRQATQTGKAFYYHGLDTISDLCSGDFAMGIDLIRRIFEEGNTDWRKASEISKSVQDKAIRNYTKQEFEYIRYQSSNGRRKYDIADRLCWLAKETLLTQNTTKEGKQVPIVKTHLDISETSLKNLENDFP